MNKYFFTLLFGVILSWMISSEMHTDWIELYQEWGNIETREKIVKRISSKFDREFIKVQSIININFSEKKIDVNKPIDYTSIVDEITKGCIDQESKALAIYKYITHNITYDHDYKIYDADECFRQKKGVCQAYSELFVRMATTAGVNATLVTGFSKDREKSNKTWNRHAWVLIEDNKGEWFFADPTWDAATISNGKIIEAPTMNWYRLDPEVAIFTHYPTLAYNQLLKNKVSLQTYRKLPFLDLPIVKLGIDPKYIHELVSTDKFYGIPTFYTKDIKFKIQSFPIQSTLKKEKEYDFSFKTHDKCKTNVYINDQLIYSENKASTWHKIKIRSNQKGTLLIMANTPKKISHYYAIAKYEVK